ncbi:MAG: di-trans,poly-cis-decaprenylcistransferase [Pyrinomonadaceae bacterium]
MLQRALSQSRSVGLHVAIIMDGHGRWATARGLARTAGHRAGAQTVRRVVEAAPNSGIDILTLYAFSADNWRRPAREVTLLMRLLRRYLLTETERCVTNGVRVSFIGRRDRLPAPLRATIAQTEQATAHCTALHLRLAVDYSARDSILCAATQLCGRAQATDDDGPRLVAATTTVSTLTRATFARQLGAAQHEAEPAPDVDLLIRTGGEQRLSDFLLWECAYAELYFTRRMWPEFSAHDLAAAVAEFHARARRFGGVPVAAVG